MCSKIAEHNDGNEEQVDEEEHMKRAHDDGLLA